MLKIVLWSVGGVIALCAAAAVAYAAYIEMTTKEPPYTSVRQDGDIEIRDYAPMIIAEVATSGPQNDALYDGFRALAGYIFGGNRTAEEIAMTAPVVQQPENGTEIAMTAPVIQRPDGGTEGWTIGFVMPEEWTMATLPVPADPAITLREVPTRRVAVIRFSGMADDDLIAANTAQLVRWLEREQLTAIGPPTNAFYNAPWIPGFLRRNEVMVEIAIE